MTIFRRLFIAVCACAVTSACASAPINLAADATAEPSAAAMPAERLALHEASDALLARYREAGWTGASPSLAERWAGRMTDQAAGDGTLISPAETYLRRRNAMSATRAASVLGADVAEARALAARVDAAAVHLSQGGFGLTRAELTDDLGEVEDAIAATRRALDLFDAVIAFVDDDLSETARADLLERRDAFAATARRLSDRADELADLRRAARSGIFS